MTHLERTVKALRTFVARLGCRTKILTDFAWMNHGLKKKSKCHCCGNFLH
jgi:hypothetical protein